MLPNPVFTIERPWIPVKTHKGGKPFESCIPDGYYHMNAWHSDKHSHTWVLSNSLLNVYASQDEVPETGGRYACLIHVGNYVSDVQGCISPGLSRDIMKGQNAVVHSGDAMEYFRGFMSQLKDNHHFLDIDNVNGTSELLPWQ